MRQRGTIKKWNDDKGFGFIAPDGGTPDVFVHIKSLPRFSARPVEGDAVSYELGMDDQRRPRALDTLLESSARVWSPRTALTCVAAAFLAALALAALLGRIPSAVPTAYLLISAFTAAAYASDKARAGRDEWRIPENTLHLLELLGGWPGALIAQHWLRHKTRKLSFQFVFWLIVIVHLAGWIALKSQP